MTNPFFSGAIKALSPLALSAVPLTVQVEDGGTPRRGSSVVAIATPQSVTQPLLPGVVASDSLPAARASQPVAGSVASDALASVRSPRPSSDRVGASVYHHMPWVSDDTPLSPIGGHASTTEISQPRAAPAKTAARSAVSPAGAPKAPVLGQPTAQAGQMGAVSVVSSSVPPKIIQVSDDCEVVAGATFRLEVVATGVPSPSYQWHMDTVGYPSRDMDGETASVLIVDGFEGDLEGVYKCRVSNSEGTVVSRSVRVALLAP
jgi:hypothetical protein